MKALLIPGLLITALLALGSCDNIKKMNAVHDGDDAYYSLKDAKADRAAAKLKADELKKQQDADAAQRLLDQQTAAARSKPGSDYYDEAFDYDDYYDGEYAARLRHFDHPVSGYGYYDNYYTNSYFYNQDPFYYGTSVYCGYNFWGPSYYAYSYCPTSFWMYNNGWGWGTGLCCWNQPWGGWYDPWGYNSWYNPWGYSSWNPWGYGAYACPNYLYGYNGLYGNPYNNYYYNSNDQNSNFYGPRNSPSSTDGRVAGSGGPTFGERFMDAEAVEHNIAGKDVDNTTINRAVISDIQAANTSSTTTSRTNVNSSNTDLPATTTTSGTTTTNRSTTYIPANPNSTSNAGSSTDYGRTNTTNSSSTNSSSTYSRPTTTSSSSGTYSNGSSGSSRSNNSSSGSSSSGSSGSSRPSSSGGGSSSHASSGGSSTRPR